MNKNKRTGADLEPERNITVQLWRRNNNERKIVDGDELSGYRRDVFFAPRLEEKSGRSASSTITKEKKTPPTPIRMIKITEFLPAAICTQFKSQLNFRW